MYTDIPSYELPENYSTVLPEKEPEEVSSDNNGTPPSGVSRKVYKFGKALAIVANFEHYRDTVDKKLGSREGSEHDMANLVGTFEEMGCFDVEKWVDDEKLTDFLLNLEEVAEDYDGLVKYDCLVLVVMGHGREGGIVVGLNDEDIPIKDIWGLFTADNCRPLANKPKFFFIQACRGETLGEGVILNDKLEQGIIAEESMELLSIPIHADILLVYSTFSGTISLRGKTGSPFIQDLCDVLSSDHKKEYLSKEPILNLMTELCYRMANRSYQLVQEEGKSKVVTLQGECQEAFLVKQMPTLMSTLRKLFYFRVSND